MSRKTSAVPWSPCSTVSTPASTARRIPSAVIACAATGRPYPWAVSTSTRSSSWVNVGRASPLGPTLKSAYTLIQSAPWPIWLRTTRATCSAPVASSAPWGGSKAYSVRLGP